MSAELELTSWRRMTSELYAAVRAEDDPQRGHALWRRGRDELFRSHPQSPLPPGDPLRTTGLPYWPYDPGLRFEVPLLPAERAMSLSIPTSDGVTPMARIGCVQLPQPLEAVIDVWWLRQYAGGLFLPLRDGTAGESSYGGGRYALDTAKGADLGGRAGRLIIDLNFLYHPSCRYNDAWVCPLAPPGNTISAPVSAGERLPPNFGLPVVGVVEVKPAASVPLRALVAMGGDATRCQPPAFMRHVSCNVAVETGNTVQSATLGLALHHWWRGL